METSSGKEAKRILSLRRPGGLNAILALEDGSVWKGTGFGAEKKVTGEVVFNTGMMGYTQSVTDPSYTGQILCQTYPLVGNYGVCREEFESPSPKITGYAVSQACEMPSHHTSGMSLDEWLKAEKIPGIQGLDTRELTKVLRMRGTMLGALQVSAKEIDEEKLVEVAKNATDPSARDLVGEVTIEAPVNYGKNVGGPVAVVIDCGMKEGIAQSLLASGMEVIRVPASFSADKIMKLSPDGVVVSNGPGDPKMAGYVAEAIAALLEYRMPLMGICLGNQLLGHALGCDTYKLKFGHRGQNHPVLEKATGRCYITSQNHGFAISPESVKECGKDLAVSFVNVNDGTVEGIEHRKLPAFAVQFHPEARPGPVDTGFLFDKFARMMDKHAKR